MWCFFCFIFSLSSQVLPPFSEKISSREIIQSRCIQIPEYPNAYNPSLIAYKDGYLLTFRISSSLYKGVKIPRVAVSMLGIARLDSKFNVIPKSVQLLNLQSHPPLFSLTAEDGRLFLVGERLFLFFNDASKEQNKSDFVMYVAELEDKGGEFAVKGKVKELLYDKAIDIEKNWTPFVREGKCYCIYSEEPKRIILEVDLDTGFCREVVCSLFNWKWPFGQVRGGTPAVEMEGRFLTFFHSSFFTGKGEHIYVMGAYMFDLCHPFSVYKTVPYPLSDRTDHDHRPKSKLVTFPGGLVVERDVLHVAWGFDDKKIFITTFDKKKLLNAMQ
jgi:predicted GH43/DUF377 family glycosyl hydrolase